MTPNFSTFVKTSLILPLRLFFTEPIVFATSLMAATVYGIVYLFAESLPIIYVEEFGFKPRGASLVFLTISIGVALTFLPRLYDMRIASRLRRKNVPLEPEDKLATLHFAAAPALAAGLWWFACTVPPLIDGVSPWASITSLVLIGYSVEEFDNLLSGYLTDCYGSCAASANAPMAFLRATLSGVFPLFGQRMFRDLGPANALFVLAGIAIAYCGVAALFGFYGKQIRQRSPFAEKTWAAAAVSDQKLDISDISFPLPPELMFRKDGFF